MRQLMWFTIGFVLSCITGIYLFAGNLVSWFALHFCVIAIILLLLKYKPCKIAGIVLLGVSAGVLWMWGYDAVYLQPARQYDGQICEMTIQVADYSYTTDYGSAVDGAVELGNRKYRIRVYFDDIQKLEPGDKVQGLFALGMTIPDGQEESEYYQGKGIFLLATQEDAVTMHPGESNSIQFYTPKLRRQITDMLDTVFPEDVIGFVRALLLGDSSLLSYEEDTAFKVSGIRHVIAVSGLHVSILFSLVYTAVGKHRVRTLVVGFPVLLLFAAVAGFTPSIVRACVMQSMMMFALFLKREYDPPTALAFAVLIMLAINPMTITSVSFQLSVGCMVGILLFSSRVSGYILRTLGHPTGKSFWGRLARWLSGSIGVTLSAMTATTPLVAWYFGMVSLIGVLTNLVTLWIISFVFYGIMLACICGAVFLPLGKGVAWLVSWLVRYVLYVAKLFASFPLAAVYTCSVYIVLWIGVCYLLFLVFLICKKKHPILLTGCMLTTLCVCVAASYIEPRMDDFRMTVFDVGEGQSILFQCEGKYYLVDCGGSSNDEAADIVAEALLSQGVTDLDGIILTHYDADHSGGLRGLLSRVDADVLYLPDIPDDGNTKVDLSQHYEKKITWVRKNTALEAATLIPAPVDVSDENESSLCVLFQWENYDILISGDRGATGEKALLESFDLPQLELLVAGHHGAPDSTGLALLSKTMPNGVVISTGGRYGHPAADVLDRLELFGCKVWRTDQNGTIVFRR